MNLASHEFIQQSIASYHIMRTWFQLLDLDSTWSSPFIDIKSHNRLSTTWSDKESEDNDDTDGDANDGDGDDCYNDTGRTCAVSMYHRRHDFILLEHERCKTLISCRMINDDNGDDEITKTSNDNIANDKSINISLSAQFHVLERFFKNWKSSDFNLRDNRVNTSPENFKYIAMITLSSLGLNSDDFSFFKKLSSTSRSRETSRDAKNLKSIVFWSSYMLVIHWWWQI